VETTLRPFIHRQIDRVRILPNCRPTAGPPVPQRARPDAETTSDAQTLRLAHCGRNPQQPWAWAPDGAWFRLSCARERQTLRQFTADIGEFLKQHRLFEIGKLSVRVDNLLRSQCAQASQGNGNRHKKKGANRHPIQKTRHFRPAPF